MNTALSDRLTALKNYRTRYEVVLISPTGEKQLVCYTSGKSARGLMDTVRNRLEPIQKASGVNAWMATGRARAETSCGWHVVFSGRTQRECYLSTELKYIGNP